jgi:hypothetical protein
MQVRIQLFSVFLGISLLLVIFQLIRKNKLLEQYSLLWIASAVILLVMAICRGLLERLSNFIGIYYPPSALFFVAIFCGMVIALHFSVVISRLNRQNNTLAQEIGILRSEIDRLKNESRTV